jgi:poly-gamma-glutamate capsule biosynthesis protein CapA/YwtB (metallophosphatase superfamily)
MKENDDMAWARQGSLALAIGALSALWGCDHPPPCVEETAAPERLSVTLRVVDEAGAAVAGATVEVGGAAVTADGAGNAALDLAGPAVAVVSAPGKIVEPVPVGWSNRGAPLDVRLLSDGGGSRIVIHSAGDVMMGRRYEAPFEGEPLLRPGSMAGDAARVLSAVRPAFAAADLRTVNLETVVADLPDEAKYPGKRFILLTKPAALGAIKGLGVDLAGFANNHARDYMDDGIALTKEALAAAGLPSIGASATEDGADTPIFVDVRGTKVGMVAYTTVNGSVVNDQYPLEDEPVPANVKPKEQWLYQPRPWGYSMGTTVIPEGPRRIGTAWQIFSGLEPGLEASAIAPFWASIEAVYPEMQDWVARRGHGGAALWAEKASTARIAEVAAQSDIVIVQLHAGFQFQEATSKVVHQVAHDAIDAGAHLVVCHHPHVLQGLEYYKGRLIAYSLGNFVFDQDFLATFASMFLRTIWDKGALVEARIVPVELDAYRPLPSVDGAASATMLRLWERSLLPVLGRRDDDFAVRSHVDTLLPGSVQAHLVVEGNTARVVEDPPEPVTVALDVGAGEVARIELEGLVDARLGLAPGTDSAVRIGRDLFGWGHFEDDMADGEPGGDTHWALDACQKRVVFEDAPEGRGFLRLLRNKRWSVLTRAVARIPLAKHRGYEADSSTPVDPAPTYSLRAAARLEGDSKAWARFDIYHFDDTDPTEDPESILLRSFEVELPVEPGAGWQEVEVALPEGALEGTPTANMVLLYASVDPPRATGEATLDLDELAFVEWRDAARMPAWLGVYEYVKNTGNVPVALSFTGLPARR